MNRDGQPSSALAIFPTINGGGGNRHYQTSLERDHQYVKELPLGDEGDEYDPTHGRKKYEAKELMEEFVKSRPMLLDRKAPKIKK